MGSRPRSTVASGRSRSARMIHLDASMADVASSGPTNFLRHASSNSSSSSSSTRPFDCSSGSSYRSTYCHSSSVNKGGVQISILITTPCFRLQVATHQPVFGIRCVMLKPSFRSPRARIVRARPTSACRSVRAEQPGTEFVVCDCIRRPPHFGVRAFEFEDGEDLGRNSI